MPWRRGPLRPIPRFFARSMPKGIFPRSLIIIIAPMVLLQSVLAFVFMERHWQMVTQRLSAAVVRDVASIIDMIETFPQDARMSQVIRIADQDMDLDLTVLPPSALPAPVRSPIFDILNGILGSEMADEVKRPFWLDTTSNPNSVEIRVQIPDHVLKIVAKRKSVYASKTYIFWIWMVGTSLVLIVIAILFLRNQIRPIQALAEAADNFGRGQQTPADFRPAGASEVRRASLAFIQMRDRIERQIEQRTQMLNGVSHDLRTILTRFRLQLEFMDESEDKRELQRDVEEMQRMLEGYLAFAKDEQGEDVGELDLEQMMQRLQSDADRKGKSVETDVDGDPLITVRPDSFTRLVTNLVANAVRHANRISVRARHEGRWLTVAVEDDGPGIPAEKRDEVFKPFVRLDTARNIDAGGTGLGLSIARDIARSHGGDILLSDSSMGGLRALVRIPA
ncbi:ATP-binding protein [Aureimonas leprariae]|uniref:histidine kinase n=1 Tax=Plantimonas leprariae TaxID=2615207 RepID=A0A7V7PPH7_9HYPH|nr:ATP-binding protein [Aureimonas leprariae]KAB0679906.1 HAMP domain-containing protein [Aureimonas leprariae]